MRPDTCLDCEHFYFEPACRGYSDMTPGWDMRIGCYKDNWELDKYEDTTEDYREYLLSARECSDFEERKPKT